MIVIATLLIGIILGTFISVIRISWILGKHEARIERLEK